MSLVRLVPPSRVAVSLVAFLFQSGICFAQPIESETILTGLNRPTGIAVAPGGTAQNYTLFVAEQGAGRVVKWQSGSADSVATVITGLATSADPLSSATISSATVGLRRLGICFHGRQRLLVVGDVSASEGYALLFDLPVDGEVHSAAHPKQRLDRTAGTDGKFGRFCKVAGGKHSIYLATTSSVGKISRADARSAILGDFKPLIELGGAAGRVVMALNPKHGKGYLAVTRSNSDGSFLTTHDPTSGKNLLETSLDIQQIVALAYSPISGRLYAAVATGKTGGIYRLDADYRAGKQVCQAVSIAKCPQPTDMLFTPDGSLLVAAHSESDAEAKSQGVVIKLHGNL